MSESLPKPLVEFLRMGTMTFEADGEEWTVEVEDVGALPTALEKEYANALVFANNGVGDLLFLLPQSRAAEPVTDGASLAFGERVFLFRHEGVEVEAPPASLGDILRPPQVGSSDHPKVVYFGSNRPIRPGDIVELKLWLVVKQKGEVTYVPGTSKKKSSMERDGLAWVEVRLDNGDRVSTIVDPANHQLKKSVKWQG